MPTRNHTNIVAVTAASFLALALSLEASGQSGPGWTELFDRKTLEGWDQIGEANWRVEDGAIVADKGKGGHLVSRNSYKNFMIYAEFWSDEKANSGIFIRCKDPKKITSRDCYEMNIFDERPDPSYGTGAIVNIAEANPTLKAAGKWNTFEILADGRHLAITLNGQKTADVRNGLLDQGHLTLQYGAGVIKFRKVAIKTL
ncbi:MAG: DUF1080 domain-containing protein [Xanthobacteraceae bacterium]